MSHTHTHTHTHTDRAGFSLWRVASHKRGNSPTGFSLIELLVVVAILAVLAAIVIPLFLNQKTKAQNVSVKSDLRNLATTMKSLQPATGAFTVDGSALLPLITNDGWKASKGTGAVIAVNCSYSDSGNTAVAAEGEFMIQALATVGNGTWTARTTPYTIFYDSKTSTWYEYTSIPTSGINYAMNDTAAGSAYNICYGGVDKRTIPAPG